MTCLFNKRLLGEGDEQPQKHDLIEFKIFKLKTSNPIVVIVKEVPRIVLKAASTQNLTLIGAPVQFTGSEADLTDIDLTVPDDQNPAKKNKEDLCSDQMPVLVKNLNADSGVDWRIKCTVNKKHPIKTHAKG